MSLGNLTFYWEFCIKPLIGVMCFGVLALHLWAIHLGPLSFRGDE